MNDHGRVVVGCDLDDVLADFVRRFMELAHLKFGVNPVNRPVRWDWSDILTQDQVHEIWRSITSTFNFWTTLDLAPGASPGRLRALDNVAQLYFPTARSIVWGDPVSKQSACWLENKFEIAYPTVIVSNEKGPLAAALKYDFFIDDRMKNCKEVKEAVPTCRVYLRDAGHNLSDDPSALGIERVANFDLFAVTVLNKVREEAYV